MSSIASSRQTLVDNIFSRTIYSDIALVAFGVALTAVSAQIQIPVSPVPFTFQTLAVLLIGASYGAARAAITMTVYALAGLVGIPVFADFSSGPEVLVGATGGFIIGFIFAAMLTGYLAERNWSDKPWKMFLNFSFGSILIYAFGIPVLAMVAFGSDLIQAAQAMLPYVLWDALKAVIAGTTLPAAWLLVKKIKKN
ncbi:MAG: biotin transporter BioY [Acidobacteria bacterium]|nr:biotin transporter BioY [Acidobacteriota bacterium]